MQLMDVPHKSKFKVVDPKARVPPASLEAIADKVYIMGYLDGMYCNAYDSNNNRVYFAAWTEVEIQ
jgi:hypothetical protein